MLNEYRIKVVGLVITPQTLLKLAPRVCRAVFMPLFIWEFSAVVKPSFNFLLHGFLLQYPFLLLLDISLVTLFRMALP